MMRLATIVAFVFVLLGSLSFSAAAAPQSTRPDGSYQTAQNWNDRVCCKRGWQDWWTTRRACQRAGGHQTRNRDCRDGNDWNNQWDQRWWGWTGGNWDRRVCCKRGNRDWWSTARECRNSFGYITSNRECRDDRWDNRWDNRWRDWSDWDRRVCCKRGNRDWWTTARECRAAFGYQTANRECRHDTWDERWDNRWQGWSGDWNRRVCCKRGNRDWWTTARECRSSFGYETANRECRNDSYDNNYDNDGDYGSDNDGDYNRRVCCKRGDNDWWTTLGQCRNAGGHAVRNDECRNDY